MPLDLIPEAFHFSKGGIPTKLIKKLAIALTSILTIIAIGTTALAGLYDQGSGGSFISAKYGSYAYGWRNGTDLLWQVEVYVATTEDGIIDKTKPSLTDDFIDGDNIAYVGSLLYTNNVSGNIIMPVKSYTAEKSDGVRTDMVREYTGPYTCTAHYQLPETTAYYNINAPFLNESRKTFTYNTKFGERTMYITRTEPRGLPTSISGSYNYATTKAIIESEEFLSGIVEDLKSAIGETQLNAIVKQSNPAAYEKAKEYAYAIGDPNAAIARLFPDSDDPLVQWAVVATPLAVNTANCGYDIGFWITRDNSTSSDSPVIEAVTTQNYGTISFAMDAYIQAWYNGLTRNMINLEGYRSFLNNEYNIPLSYLENGTGGINSGQPIQGEYTENWGLLRKEYSTNFNKLADIAYIDSTRWPDHCLGIYSPKDDWHSSASTYGRYGGITIAFSKEPDAPKEIPVYYYITPDPDGPITPPGTAAPPTFTPEPPPGTKVKKVVIPDKPLPGSNPPQHFPTDEPEVPPNPDGTYPINPPDPPYILVECEQTALPVYYHVFTFTNTTGKKYDNVFEFLKDKPKLSESDASEIITCKETLKPLADNKTASYKPNPDYADGGVIVEALSTSTTAGNDRWSPLITNMSSQLSYNTSISYDHVPKGGMLLINPAKEPLGNQSVEYYGKTFTKGATRSIHVKVYALADSEPTTGTERDTDRIKTYDVTQFIVVDGNSTLHIDSFSSYAGQSKDVDSFNTNKMPAANATHDKTNGGYIYSIKQAKDSNNKVHATNYLGTYNYCNASCSVKIATGHTEGCYERDENGNKVLRCTVTPHHHNNCGWRCPYKISTCHWLEEYVEVYFGNNQPSQVWKTKKTSDGKGVATESAWKDPDKVGYSSNVGFVVPLSYYSKADTVKVAASHSYGTAGSYKNIYTLPDFNVGAVQSGYHNIKASKYAVFDILGRDPLNYWIQYMTSDNSLQVGTSSTSQYAIFDATSDVKVDKTNTVGDGKFDFIESGTKIDAVQFIAHRDLLSGDNVATSLAVSGYMLKYGTNSSTQDYIQLMKNANFTFKGVTNIANAKDTSDYTFDSDASKIGHEDRVVWISLATDTSSLQGTQTGLDAKAYNTDYVGANGSHTPNERQKTHFGLGGLTEDGAGLWDSIKADETNLGDINLTINTDKGDAARATWYFASYRTGGNADCYGLVEVDHSYHGGSSCCGGTHASHTESNYGNQHSLPHAAAVDSCLSNEQYITHKSAADVFINNMKPSKTWSQMDIDGTQTGAIEKIDSSRRQFNIPLAVEGTTAGKFDESGKDGLKYGKDLLRLDNGVLIYKPSTELTGSAKNAQKSYEENTFEIKNADYSTLGSRTRENDLLAEYRYTVPTRSYVFNPSYYMRFDDDFNDNNKSVWMLSNQPREINFKNIFSIRLVQPLAGSGNTEAGAKGGYPTIVDSAWSTDKEDINTQAVTGLPVLKAGNSYKAETAETQGTITAYVVLQDPEFTGNPNDSQMNKEILQEYNAEMQNILKEMGAVANEQNTLAGYTSRNTAEKSDKLGFAMYTNLTNGSSTNSQFQIHGSNELDQKEPMVITHSTVSASVTTGAKEFDPTKAEGLCNWEFYALQGNEVKPVMKNDKSDTGSVGFEKDKDISDTTSANKRKFLGVTVKSQSSAEGYIASTLSEINGRLTGIMANGQKGEGLAYPTSTSPYLTGDNDFSWYTEDYEGFIVAVYSISFTIEGDGTDINDKKDTNAGIITDFSAAYRHESDWRQPTNALAADDGHKLETPVSYTDVANVTNSYIHNSNITVNKDGTLVLLTEKTKDHDSAETILKDWSANLKKDYGQEYTAAIYGIGLELANVPIHFGSKIEANQSSKDYCTDVIGSDVTRRSFFYQPTYFNVRGSVYDTTH